MLQYFCVSDVHSYFSILQKTLDDNGFDINNPDHVLVVCGDLFDRGDESSALYEFVRSLPDERFIYIRGNHEDLLIDCFNQIQDCEIISPHHISNGTVKTIMDLSGVSEKDYIQFVYDPYSAIRGNALDKIPKIINYINKKCVNYVEIGDFIFVHGWIPFAKEELHTGKIKYTLLPNWRDCNWNRARWENGMDAWHHGIKLEGRTIVCGHWHCSWGWSHIRQERQEFPQKNKTNWLDSFEVFADDGIIALDACTTYSGKINCIVLEAE